MSTPLSVNARLGEQNMRNAPTYSPRLEQIKRMRGIEEESLRKCVAILRKMGQAMGRQKNISKDVKDGVSELNGQMDVIESCRRIWKELESIRNSEAEKVAREEVTRNTVILQHTEEKETPATGRAKRPASSPAAPDSHKKIKENGQEGWQTVTYRRNKQKPEKRDQTPAPITKEMKSVKRKRKRKARKDVKKLPEAVLIKPNEGISYAEVLRDLKRTVKPEEADIAIRSVRKTKNGSILLELAEGGCREKFCEAIKTSLKNTVNVSSLKPRTTIEIRDLDALSEVDEVSKAVRDLVKSPDEEVSVRLTKTNTREQRRAFVTLATEKATTILNSQRIKIGWIYCRVKKIPNVQRTHATELQRSR